MGRLTVTPEMIERIKIAYEAGRSMKSVAADLGISVDSLKKLNDTYDMSTKSRAEVVKINLTDDQVKTVMKHLILGWNLTKIGELVDMHHTTLRRRILEHPELAAKMPKPGVLPKRLGETELDVIERLAYSNIPPDTIAKCIGRPREWFKKQLEAEEPNEIQLHYALGRMRGNQRTENILEKKLADAETGELQNDMAIVSYMRHWDQTRGDFTKKVERTDQTEAVRQGATSASAFDRAEKLRSLNERQLQMMMHRKLTKDEILEKSLEEILTHGRQLNQLGADEFQKIIAPDP